MPEFISDGIRLRFHLAGPDDGPPTLLLHGYASDYGLNWVGTRWQEALTQAGRLVIGLDFRGHGGSEKPHQPEAYRQALMAADAVALLDHLQVGTADCIGYSMGAHVALRTVIDHGDRLRRAVLGGIGLIGGFDRAPAIARRMLGDESESDPAAIEFHRFAAAREVNDLEALAACITGWRPDFSAQELGRVRVPVLVVVGDQDDRAPGARSLAEQIPGAQFLSLTGRNHMNAVPARQFKEATLEFLQGDPPA